MIDAEAKRRLRDDRKARIKRRRAKDKEARKGQTRCFWTFPLRHECVSCGKPRNSP